MNIGTNKRSAVSYPKLIAAELLTLGIGMLGGLIARDGFSSYEKLQMPPLAPPTWVFPVVWTILYLIMGYSVYLVWQSGDEQYKNALTLFAVYMVLNFLWPTVFFVHGAFLAALILLFAQLILLIVCCYSFSKISTLAAYFLVPTIVWTVFAGYLNAAFFFLN